MASLSITDFLNACDNLHEWIEEMQAVCGSGDAWVVAPRSTMEQNRIMEALFELKAHAADPSAHSMTDEQAAAIMRHLDREKGRWPYWVLARMQILQIMRAMDNHLRKYGSGGINAFLRINDERIGYWFQCAVGDLEGISNWPVFPLDPENVFPPGYTATGGSDDYGENHGAIWNDISGNAMGHSLTTAVGPPANTYTQGEDINTNLYGKSNLFLQCVAGPGGTASTFNVECVKIDGTTEWKNGIIIFNQPVGAISRADIPVHGTDMYVGIRDIVLTAGGVINDEFVVLSELERFTKIT